MIWLITTLTCRALRKARSKRNITARPLSNNIVRKGSADSYYICICVKNAVCCRRRLLTYGVLTVIWLLTVDLLNVRHTSIRRTVNFMHLSLDSEVTFIDETTIHFTGSVYIGGTAAANNNHPCPLVGVNVCLYQHMPTERKLACDVTNGEGQYEVPAEVGLTIEARVFYNNHTFKRIGKLGSGSGVGASGKMAEFFDVTAESPWINIDFEDVTTRELTVEVSQGACNRKLGNAQLSLIFPNCPGYDPEAPGAPFAFKVQSDRYSKVFTVPAHPMDVKFEEMSGRPRMSTYFDSLLTRRQVRVFSSSMKN